MPDNHLKRTSDKVRHLRAQDLALSTGSFVPKAKTVPPQAELPFDTSGSDVLTAIHNYLRQQGLIFEKNFIEAFLLALKTKPFVILSGISGTGKSALPRALMKMVGNSIGVIAVAPDWTDNADMLGYFDVQGTFVEGEFTSIVQKAAQNLESPYFVVLDEMNLARVEYYFAQTLSGLESRRVDKATNHVVYDDYLFNSAVRERLEEKEQSELADLKLTPNVYIIGTVNVDETTHPFSKKVLDRANVLESGDVDLMQGIEDETESDKGVTAVPTLNAFFAGKVTNLNELKSEWESASYLSHLQITETLKEWVALLTEFAQLLKPHKMNFGFRVRDEVCIYLYHAACLDPDATHNEGWWYRHFDRQLVQKVLTRISGEQGQIERDIVKLFELCIEPDFNASEELASKWVFEETKQEEESVTEPVPRFPAAARKLQRMLLEVTTEDRPATSFWTA